MQFPLIFCKNAPPTFSMVHLLHRFYGVDATGHCNCRPTDYSRTSCCLSDQPTGKAIFAPLHLRKPSADFHETQKLQLDPRPPNRKIQFHFDDVGDLGE